MNTTKDAPGDEVQYMYNGATQSETDKQEGNAATEEKSSSADNIEGATKEAEDPPSENSYREIPPVVEVAQDDSKLQGGAKENETNVEGSTPRHGARDEATKEEEKTNTKSSQDDEEIPVSIKPATDDELNGECIPGTLENCYAPKAFAWNCLGKLFTSKDANLIKTKLANDKVRLWELFYHGVNYSKAQLGISPVVMASYADRIFTLMRDKYYGRYSSEDLKEFVPEETPRRPYTLPQECIMLPIFRKSREGGEKIGQVSHVFLENYSTDNEDLSDTEPHPPSIVKKKGGGKKREQDGLSDFPGGENSPKASTGLV
jgi:hypothetical protein